MKRQHRMPFGAEVLEDGQVRFRLWAPVAKQVELCLQGPMLETTLPMVKEDEGWFSLTTTAQLSERQGSRRLGRIPSSERAAHGSAYRFRINGALYVPDPASRAQLEDVHGFSRVIDPTSWDWEDGDWQGRPWEEAVIYELHVGSFTSQGTFAGVKEQLDYLADLGVTAIELMPVADFPGKRNWGYDGVLPFAPDTQYGGPNDLKDLIQTAHRKGIMVFLDVVYNHFGPEGNYLHAYAPCFFSKQHHTPWGAAINFDGPHCRVVRDFFIHNALYWLEEYHVDGLRLDAVHAIADRSCPDILEELAQKVREGPGKSRHIHLILENDRNASRYLIRDENGQVPLYTAQWNDDTHHALHVLLTGETEGYYIDYADKPIWYLGRCLSQGFAYQGEPSRYRGGVRRGEPSRGFPATAFVNFLQTHDQVGNRAFGERLTTLTEPRALRAATAVLLLAPSVPLLFMGEEFGTTQPFLFFCEFEGTLATAVREGRHAELARCNKFADPAVRDPIPDPNEVQTFERTRLNWSCVSLAPHDTWLQSYRHLLTLRHREIIPRLPGMQGERSRFNLLGERGLAVHWGLGDGSALSLLANFGIEAISGVERPAGDLLYANGDEDSVALAKQVLLPWSVAWFIDRK